jgi:hypothetical protein
MLAHYVGSGASASELGRVPGFLNRSELTYKAYDSVSSAASALASAAAADGINYVPGFGITHNGDLANFYQNDPSQDREAQDYIGRATEVVRGMLQGAESDGVSRIIDGRFPTKEEDPSADNFHPTRDDSGRPIPGSGNMDDYDRATQRRVRWPKGKDPESLAIKEKIGSISDIRARTAKENYLVGTAVSGPSAAGTRGDSGDDFERSGKYVTKGGKTYLKGSQGSGGVGAKGVSHGGVDKSPSMTQVNMNISTPNASTFLKNSNAIRQRQRVQSASS